MSAMEAAIIMTLLFLPELERLRVLHLRLYSMFTPGLLNFKTTHHLADKLGRHRRIPCNLRGHLEHHTLMEWTALQIRSQVGKDMRHK